MTRSSETIYPVVPQDIFNYLVGKYSANNQLHCILKIKGKVNEEVLQQAICASFEAEPILACGFVEEERSAIWKNQKAFYQLRPCSLIEVEDVDKALETFIGERMEAKQDCQIEVRIFRKETDTVCLKVNHACCDAGGLKGYTKLLVAIYNQMLAGQYTFQPLETYNRGQEAVLQLPEITAKIKRMSNRLEKVDDPGHTVAIPCTIGVNEEPAVVRRQIKREHFNNLRKYAHGHGATINDVCLAAYCRAISRTSKIKDNLISVCFTSDLRKYLSNPRKNSVYNLSGMNPIRIADNKAETFDETVEKIVSQTQKVKNDFPGIDMALFFETLEQASFREADCQFQQFAVESTKDQFCNPWLSNVGILAEEKVYLGLAEVEDYYMVGSACYSPGFMLIASTYDDTLTLSANFFDSTLKKNTVKQIIDLMAGDIEGLDRLL